MTISDEYRIALRPDEKGADPLDPRTLMDDIVVKNVSMFHAEQMSADMWWVCCYLDGSDERITWNVTIGDAGLEWRVGELPDDDDLVYEHEIR